MNGTKLICNVAVSVVVIHSVFPICFKLLRQILSTEWRSGGAKIEVDHNRSQTTRAFVAADFPGFCSELLPFYFLGSYLLLSFSLIKCCCNQIS